MLLPPGPEQSSLMITLRRSEVNAKERWATSDQKKYQSEPWLISSHLSTMDFGLQN